MRSRPNFATDPTFREASCTTAVAKHMLQHVDIAYFKAKRLTKKAVALDQQNEKQKGAEQLHTKQAKRTYLELQSL